MFTVCNRYEAKYSWEQDSQKISNDNRSTYSSSYADLTLREVRKSSPESLGESDFCKWAQVAHGFLFKGNPATGRRSFTVVAEAGRYHWSSLPRGVFRTPTPTRVRFVPVCGRCGHRAFHRMRRAICALAKLRKWRARRY